MMKRHTISVLVENHPGVLARIAGLFSGRGFNISGLSVGETEDPTVSRMTVVVRGDDQILEQVMKQLNKLVDVIRVTDLTKEDFIERDLVLIKVKADSASRSEILQITDIFRARIVDVAPKAVTIEATGLEDKIDALVSMLEPFGIIELARTGSVALSRASTSKGR
jgi:acetolactate synthase-1/3 small subunit